MKQKSVCMITGVGDGTGAYTARRFAKAGYHLAMVARDKNRLSNLENDLKRWISAEVATNKGNFYSPTCRSKPCLRADRKAVIKHMKPMAM